MPRRGRIQKRLPPEGNSFPKGSPNRQNVRLKRLLISPTLVPRRRRQPPLPRPSGCYRYRGSPSSRRGPEPKKIRQTGRRSASVPWCRSYRKKRDRPPFCLILTPERMGLNPFVQVFYSNMRHGEMDYATALRMS